jgi:YVTN family beta-propeller protein
MKIVYAVLLALCVFVTCSFDSCFPVPPTPGTPAGGFPVTTRYITVDQFGNPLGSGVEPGTQVSGNWVSGGSGGSVTSFGINPPFYTDDNGNGFVDNGIVNANWTSTVAWAPVGCPAPGSTTLPVSVDPIDGIGWLCTVVQTTEGANTSTHFALPGAMPSTITAYGDFMATYGDPGLRVYVGGATPSLVNVMSATSTVPGASAVFPFPTQSNGSPLAEGFYGLVSTNVNSAGRVVSTWAPSYLAIGGTTAVSGAYGIDAADVTYIVTTLCQQGPPRAQGTCKPTITQTVEAQPLVTEYYAGTVSYLGNTMAVGSYPVAIKSYGSALVFDYNDGTQSESHRGPANAVVVNSGSSNVTILDLKTYTTAATVSVGAEPMAVALNSAASTAYVASYGNGTLAAINLSSDSLVGTVTGITGAQSVAMDPGGSFVWVGGTNYLYKVSVSSLAVVGTYPVSGQVTSLAASNAQNELVYTLVQNCCSASSQYSANELSLATMASTGTHASASANPYAAYTMNGTLPSAATLPQATVVSAQFSNGMAASATPTGFVVYDLEGHTTLMTGTTPTPVRGIAADPNGMFAYFTVPDSNEYIAVPLESQ